MSEIILHAEIKHDVEFYDALSNTYQVLPEGVTVHSEIDADDLRFGLANATPVQL
jgi:hypothetical protein